MSGGRIDRSARNAGRAGAARPLSGSFRQTAALRIPLATAAKIHRAADLTRNHAVEHYEKHRDTFIARAYTRLLVKSAPTLALTPPGVTVDPKALLAARARKEVAYRHGQRLLRIEATRKSMLATGKLRDGRDLQWGGQVRNNPSRKGREPSRASTPTRGISRAQSAIDAKVTTAQDRARRKAEAHLVKHQEKWTGKRFEEVRAAFEGNGKTPQWAAPHVRDAAMEAANRSVKEKHEARLERIDRACENMRSSGQVRESRSMGRNLALER